MSKLDLLNIVAPDMYLAEKFIKEHGNCGARHTIKNILDPWSQNKGLLFKLLGKQMMQEIGISLEKTENVLISDLSELYSFYRDSGTVIKYAYQKNLFVQEYLEFMEGLPLNFINEHILIESVLNANTLVKNAIFFENKKYVLEYKNKKLILQDGIKPLKALRKIVDFFGVENFPHFEEFRLQHSNILTSKTTKGTLVLSIHPLDYLTMSDNNNNWQTCMSWSTNGCYKRGTLEMLNSNNVLCCYIKSKKDYEFATNTYWTNKSWRQLAIVNKNIIITGKSYPYIDDELSKVVLKEITKLAEVNLGWKYKYNPQPYLDMKYIWTDYGIQRTKLTPEKKNILLTSNFMYHDIMKDKETTYWCVRNKVDKQKTISYSGKTYCLDCGKEFEYRGEDGVDEVICDDCYIEHSCVDCGKYLQKDDPIFHTHIGQYCLECYQGMKLCPDCGELVRYPKKYMILNNQVDIDDIAKEEVQQKLVLHWYELKNNLNGVEVSTCEQCYEKLIANKELKIINGQISLKIRYLITPVSIHSEYVQNRIWENWTKTSVV